MTELIKFESTLALDLFDDADTSNSVGFEPGGGREGFETAAKQLLPRPDDLFDEMPAPWLDPDLRRLICECAANNVRRRPLLKDDLLTEVFEAVKTRDAKYYREAEYCDDPDTEEDQAVLDLLQRVLGAAPPPPPVPGPGEEHGEGPESMGIFEWAFVRTYK